jgi:hypothetical protein
MTAIKETTRARLIMFHGLGMLMLGMLLFHVRETMADFFAYGCALAMLLMTASLIFLAILDWICVAGQDPRGASMLRGFLFTSVGAAGAAGFLSLYPGATIRMYCYVIAIYALLLGFGKYQLARNWRGQERVHIVLYLLAAAALLFGVALLVVAGWDERKVITLIAFYSLFMGVQTIFSMFYLHEGIESEADRRSGLSHGSRNRS